MAETEGVLKFPIAVSCFAAQRMLGAVPLARNWEPVRAMQQALYEAGESAKKDFKTNTMLFGAFQLGDKAQSALAALTSDMMSFKVLNPSYMMHMMSDLVEGSSEAFGAVATERSRNALKDQFQNISDVLDYVNHVDAPSKLSADGTYPLEERIAEYYSRGDYPALWLIEGLGERFAQAHLAAQPDVRDLLTTGPGGTLPDKVQLMMHAGIGIAFAKNAIDRLTPWSAEADVTAAIKRFLRLVRENSIPGDDGPALESLGLVTRTWYPQLVSLVSRRLLALDADAYEFFWHGAGRAMYFSPMYMLPGLSPWEAADEEPPDEIARLNARAGVAWAFTIVNVRQPAVAADFLRHRESRVKGNEAYTNGVHSTLIMAGDMVPGHKYVTEFCAYKPDAGEPKLVEAWNKHIGDDLHDRIDKYRQALKAHDKLGEVFRFHKLPQFVFDLDA